MGAKQGKEARGKPKLRPSSLDANKDEEIAKKLKLVPLLSQYSDEELAVLGASLETRSYDKGEELVKQGESGEGFFIIEHGECSVNVKKADDTVSEVGRLKDGDYFGELALLNNKARGATVTAESEVTTFYLLRSEFQKLFNSDGFNVKFAKRAAVSAGNRSVAVRAPQGAVMTKDSATTKLILKAVNDNVLFSGQPRETRNKLVAQMYQREVKAGEVVIQQGDAGDLFFVVQTGEFDIDVDGTKVATRGAGTAFGELALMYNAPRAATVKATADGLSWVIGRHVYRQIVKEISSQQLKEIANFLKKVPLMAPLTSFEREEVSEAMEEVSFPAGTTVFKQGEEGDAMYIIQKGECVVEKDGAEVARCKAGDYFGERALLKNDPRAAMVRAVEACSCLRLGRDAFNLLLGPLEDIMNQKADTYDEGSTKAVTPKAAAPAAASTEPLKLGELITVGTLGKGSFGHVRLMKDKNDKTYALKAISKAMIVETGQQSHVMSEKNVMMQLEHPFLIKCYQTFKDRDRLYFLLEPVLGGELFTILRAQTLFDENTARFYAGCVLLAFEYMHSKDIIFRDLKPENLLVDTEGYIKITDFGFAKKMGPSRTWTLCGTPDYLAPEIVAGKGHGKGVDWWTLGILIYEMLASFPPFYNEDPMKTYAKIMAAEMSYPSHFSRQSVSLIKKLLNPKSTKRLGVVKGGAKLIKKHPWFESLDFDKLVAKEVTAPMIPSVTSAMDLSNFDDVEHVQEDVVVPYQDDGTNWDADF